MVSWQEALPVATDITLPMYTLASDKKGPNSHTTQTARQGPHPISLSRATISPALPSLCLSVPALHPHHHTRTTIIACLFLQFIVDEYLTDGTTTTTTTVTTNAESPGLVCKRPRDRSAACSIGSLPFAATHPSSSPSDAIPKQVPPFTVPGYLCFSPAASRADRACCPPSPERAVAVLYYYPPFRCRVLSFAWRESLVYFKPWSVSEETLTTRSITIHIPRGFFVVTPKSQPHTFPFLSAFLGRCLAHSRLFVPPCNPSHSCPWTLGIQEIVCPLCHPVVVP